MTSNDPVTFLGHKLCHVSILLNFFMKVFIFLEQNISPVNSVLGHLSVSFSGALADLPVGFPYRFNSSYFWFYSEVFRAFLTSFWTLSFWMYFNAISIDYYAVKSFICIDVV